MTRTRCTWAAASLLAAVLLGSATAGGAAEPPAAADAKSLEERAAALLAAAGEQIRGGQPAQAQASVAASLHLFQQLQDKHGEAACMLMQGMADGAAGDLRSAVAHLEQSLPLLEPLGETLSVWMALSMLAVADAQEGRSAAAIARYERALASIQETATGARPFSLRAFALLGKMANLPAPTEVFGNDAMVQIMKPILLPFAEASTRDGYAAVLVETGRLAEAEAQLTRARELSGPFGNFLEPSIQLHLGDLRRRQWRLAEAKENYVRALAGLGQMPSMGAYVDAPQAIRVMGNLAEIELLSGRTEEALAWNAKALERARQGANPNWQVSVLRDRADILLRAGRTGETEAPLKEALALAEQLNDVYHQALILGDLGNVAMQRGAYESAAAQLEKALALLRRPPLDEPLVAAGMSTLLSQVYLMAGSPESSTATLEQAREQARKSGFRLAEAMADAIAAERRFYAGKAGVDEIREKLKAFWALPEAGSLMMGGGMEALLDEAMGPPDGGRTTRLPLDEAMAGRPAVLGWMSHVMLGRILLMRGDLPAARTAWTQALEESRKLGNKDLTALAAAGLGAIYVREGQADKAVGYFSQAVAFMEDVASEVKGDELLTAYLGSDRHWFYDYLVEMLVRQGKTRAAFEYTERARDRALLQLLGNRRLRLKRGADAGLTAEVEALRLAIAAWERKLTQPDSPDRSQLLEDLRQAREHYQALLVRVKLLDPDYASLVAVEPLKVEEVQRELTPGTTLISYYVTAGGVHAWVVDEDRCEHVALPVDREDLRSAVCFGGAVGHDTRGAERIDGCDPAKPRAAELFYGKLIAPLLPYVRHRRLLIVPHAELHYVPFAALRDARTGRYLVQDYTLAYAPSVSALRLLRGKEHPVAGRAMVLGAPTGIDPKLPPLPAAAAEAKVVANLFGTTPLLGAAARESRLFDLAGRVDLLHIAAHGIYEPAAPLFSRIVLAPGEQRSGNLEVHEIFSDLDLSGVSLVVLSACETALGERSGGDEIVGLTRAFLYAGTPAVISTLWSVNDEASAVLMEEFYRRLLAGAPAAEALQQAQLVLLDRHGTSDPFFWAGFTLTGDPQQRWTPAERKAP